MNTPETLPATNQQTSIAHPSFTEAFRFWMKLGFISFGGPTGQIAIMQTELVEKKRWISQSRFLHALNFCMLFLVKRFALADKALRKIGEMVHDADLGDDKFQRTECVGVDRVLKGWAKAGMSDDELLLNGSACFNGLYAFLQRL